jgi:type VI secretion system secreted protein Hcp
MAAYIKFDGVDGECQDKDHKNWSQLLSMSQGIHKPGGGATGATRRRGDTILDDIQCVKELDKSSPKLSEAVCNGKVFPKVEIHFTASYTDAGRVTYLAYELKNVSVSSYQLSGAGQSDTVPTDSFSLNFEEIKVTYTENDNKGKKKGNVEYSWKVEEGEK